MALRQRHRQPALCPPLPRDRRSPAAGPAPAPLAHVDTPTPFLSTARGIPPGHVSRGPCAPERRPQRRYRFLTPGERAPAAAPPADQRAQGAAMRLHPGWHLGSSHHNPAAASRQAGRPLGRGRRRWALPTTRRGAHPPHPYLGRHLMCGDTLHRALGWHGARVTWPLHGASTAPSSIRDGDARSPTARWRVPPTARHGPPSPAHSPWHCPEIAGAPWSMARLSRYPEAL